MTSILRFFSALILALCPLIFVATIACVFLIEYKNIYVMLCTVVFAILALWIGFRIFVLVQKIGVIKFISGSFNAKEIEDIDF